MPVKTICFVAVSAVLLLTGCDRCEGEADSGLIDLRSCDARLAVARVGREDVTCGDLRARIEFERGLWTRRHERESAVERERGLASFTAMRLPRLLPEAIRQKAADTWSREKGVRLTDAEREAEERRMLKAFRAPDDVAQFAQEVGCDPEYVSRQLCAEALVKKLCEAAEPESATVTELEIDEGLQRMSDYHDRAIASNAVTWATCSNLVRRIEGGLDFAEAGERYGYNNGGEGEKWASFSRNEIEDAKLREWAFAAPAGALGIFELDDGISIVKVIGTENRTGEMAEVDLARINFAMIEPDPEPRTREHVRRELLRWKANEAQKRLFEAILERHPVTWLREKAKLTY